jgi:hypothetical protein
MGQRFKDLPETLAIVFNERDTTGDTSDIVLLSFGI